MLTIASTFDDYFGTLLFTGVAVTWLVLSYAYRIARTISRERTRREIAAYIAEGSMTPEQGERLMKAGDSPGKS